MGKTQIYGLDYLDPNFYTGLDLDMDERRFQTIENQTLALYSLFGNGIVSGWYMQPKEGADTTVQITPGYGSVGFVSASTLNISEIELVQPEGSDVSLGITFYIYALKTNTTAYDQSVSFIMSTVTIADTDNYVGLGQVIMTSTDSGITPTIYDDIEHGRVEISLFGSIGSIVNKHLHIGGTHNPSQINLAQHVKGKLSGENIENLDLSAVTKGVLSAERLPQIDHASLARIGTLTHAQIDSLLADLYVGSNNTISDITSANTMQIVLALKRLGVANIDTYPRNSIFFVPDITPDRYYSYYDTDNNVMSPYVPNNVNLASIDTVNDYIYGIEGTSSHETTIYWQTKYDFNKAMAQTENTDNIPNITVVDSAPDYITLSKPDNYKGLATKDFSLWQQGYQFTDTSDFNFAPDPDTFTDNYNLKRFFYYEFENPQNYISLINIVDKIGIGYTLTTNSDPGAMSIYFLLGESSIKETVIRPDGTKKVISISKSVDFYWLNNPEDIIYYQTLNISDFFDNTVLKTDIIGVGISYSTFDSPAWDKNSVIFELELPDSLITDTRLINARLNDINVPNPAATIFIYNDSLYADKGEVIFRFDSGYDNTAYPFAEIIPLGVIPANTLIDFKIRTSNSKSSLDNLIPWNFNIALPDTGRYIDIIVRLIADSTLVYSPKLSIVQLAYSGPGSLESPKIWDIYEDWSAGTSNNIVINGAVLTDKRAPVIAASTTNIADLSNAGNIDGITLNLNDRVLLKNQTPSSGNGIYIATQVSPASVILTRDLDEALTQYMFVKIVNGTDNAGLTYYLKTTVGITAYEFVLYNNSIIIDKINVGSWTYIRNNDTLSYTNGVESILLDIDNLYLTPYQIFKHITTLGFINPKHMLTLENGDYVIADTDNDRIVELDTSGNVIKVIQGNMRLNAIERDFAVLTASYNPRLGKMWITFSQNVSVVNDGKTKMSIVNGMSTISFSSVDPNNSNNIINVVPFSPIGNKSATLEVTFPEVFKNQINAWTGEIKLIIDSTSVVYAKAGGTTVGTTPSPTPIPTGLSVNALTDSLSTYISGPPPKYRKLINDDTFISEDGLPIEASTTVVEGDFDNDGLIETATLMGPDMNTGIISMSVYVGEIVFDNIYSPMYVQEKDTNWIVACAGQYAVMCYDNTLVRSWYIPLDKAPLRHDTSGSAWQMSNGLVVVAIPSPETLPSSGIANGEVLVINKDAGTVTTPNSSIVTRIYVGGDAVRAIPDTTETEFWVIVDDRLHHGNASSIIKVNYNGIITWSYTDTAKIFAPSDLQILSNGHLLISQ